MIKYSFIVPVYNTGKYLKKCLDSLINQTYKNFEIIVVNDGSQDDSKKIIDEYKNKYSNVIVIEQENQGLSIARNVGIKKAKGEYLLFIDSDDYVEKNLLDNIEQSIGDALVLRYQIIEEDITNNKSIYHKEKGFEVTTGKLAFKIISSYHYVETACCYVFSKKYFLKNGFKFTPNCYHEDYGLIPYCIYNASRVKSIEFLGYHYVQRENSIMSSTEYSKTVKKVYDMFRQYVEVKKKIKNHKVNKENYLLSYLANCVIVKAKCLRKSDRKEYIKRLKEEKVYNDILTDTISRKLKMFILKLNFEFYLEVVK